MSTEERLCAFLQSTLLVRVSAIVSHSQCPYVKSCEICLLAAHGIYLAWKGVDVVFVHSTVFV